MVVKSDGTNIWASCTVTSAGTINNAAQYDVPYYSASGTTNTMSGTAISGFQFDTTGAAPTAATAAQLGGLANIAAGDVVYSGGTSSALAGSADFAIASHTLSGGASAILDLHAAPATTGLLIPSAAGAIPTADGQVAVNTTTHANVHGSNGTTIVEAAAATGTGTSTACSTHNWVSTISSIAAPTCTQPAVADVTGAAPTASPTFTGTVTYPLIATTTHCAGAGTAANPSVASCSAAPSGFFSCATNASTGTCQVNTTAVTANSVIQIQPDSTLGTALSVTCNTTADSGLTAPRVSARSAGTSFTITMGTYSTNPECFSYLIIN